jgi:hypothetical protein
MKIHVTRFREELGKKCAEQLGLAWTGVRWFLPLQQ